MRLIDQAMALGESVRMHPASTLLEQATEVGGLDAILHSEIGLAYADIGLIAEALASFERGRRLDPDDSRIATDQAKVLRQVGRYKEAEAVLRDAIARDPRSGTPYSHLGALLLEIGRVDDAKAIYEAAVARYGRGYRQFRGHVLERLCELEKQRGRLSSALEYAVRGLEATPTNVDLCRVACELALGQQNPALFRELSRCLVRRGTESDRAWVRGQLEAIDS